MSLGGIPASALHRAIRRAVDADIIVMAAAGNCVRLVVWPARYDECIAVAATNSDDQPWPGTCRGASVDISAPGQNVYRAVVPPSGPSAADTVGQGQGTSFAVALTAGVAALWLAHHGRDTVVSAARARGETVQAMFRRLLQSTARRPTPWDSHQMGPGIVDARALLEADLDLGVGQQAATAPTDPSASASVASPGGGRRRRRCRDRRLVGLAPLRPRAGRRAARAAADGSGSPARGQRTVGTQRQQPRTARPTRARRRRVDNTWVTLATRLRWRPLAMRAGSRRTAGGTSGRRHWVP